LVALRIRAYDGAWTKWMDLLAFDLVNTSAWQRQAPATIRRAQNGGVAPGHQARRLNG